MPPVSILVHRETIKAVRRAEASGVKNPSQVAAEELSKQLGRDVSARTVRRWMQHARNQGLTGDEPSRTRKTVDPKLLADAIAAYQRAVSAGSKSPMKDACADLSRRMDTVIARSTFSKWMHKARNAGMVTLQISEVEKNLCDFTQRGWWRDRPEDTVEPVYNRNGDAVGTRTVLDPSIIYPPGWDGPLFKDLDLPQADPDGVTRFILTGMQDHTPGHGPALVNLKALAAHLGADISIGQTTYNKNWYLAIFGGGARDKRQIKDRDGVADWPSDLREYLTCTRAALSDTIWFCPETNVTPIAQNPVSDLQTYGKGRSVVIPHSKQELESVPRDPKDRPILAMSTGYCSPPNYIAKKAGLKAAFHHVIGALLIEIDADGYVYPHHIHADSEDGSFQIFDIRVDRGVVTTGNLIPGISLGDVHAEQKDVTVFSATMGGEHTDDQALVDTLIFEHAFAHDICDFYTRNHHSRRDPWHNYAVHLSGRTIKDELVTVGDFLAQFERPWMETHIVESNHDDAIARWLKETDWRDDPVNAELYLELNGTALRWIREGVDDSIFKQALKFYAGREFTSDFIPIGGGFYLEDIQCGWHGHKGTGGSQGSTTNYLQLSTKISKGHDHTPTKKRGVSSAGTMMILSPRYTKGSPTKWAAAHTLIYPEGRTGLLFVHAGRWRALGRKRDVAVAANDDTANRRAA